MGRPKKDNPSRRVDYLPANQIVKRYGLSAFRLQRLALGGVIRHDTRPSVFTTYSIEDVERFLGNQAPASAK